MKQILLRLIPPALLMAFEDGAGEGGEGDVLSSPYPTSMVLV